MNPQTQKEFDKLLSKPANKTCIDCDAFNPQWASVNNGCFMCIKCAGNHRGMGVHISFVRSVTMDSWSQIQLSRMKKSGNDRLKKFWTQQKFPKNLTPKQRLDNDAMDRYREQLLAMAKGEPTVDIPFIGYATRELVSKSSSDLLSNSHAANHSSSSLSSTRSHKMQGFGNTGYDPHDPNNKSDDAWNDFWTSTSSFAAKAGAAATELAQKSKVAAASLSHKASEKASTLKSKIGDEEYQSQMKKNAAETWQKTASTLSSWWTTAATSVSKAIDENLGDKDGVKLYHTADEEHEVTLYNRERKEMPALSSSQYFNQADVQQARPPPQSQAPQPPQQRHVAREADILNLNGSQKDLAAIPAPFPTKKSTAQKQVDSLTDDFDDWGFDGDDDADTQKKQKQQQAPQVNPKVTPVASLADMGDVASGPQPTAAVDSLLDFDGNGETASTGAAAAAASNTTPQQPGKVQFKTATNQKNARAVGPTMAYKHPSRSHYGQPKPELRDPKFTNPSNLLHLQRWELLESAKRWLPGEGTLITWGNYRYLIGPPIHMGMNGHIHYCYKYPMPPHKREQKKEKEKKEKEKEKEAAAAARDKKDKDTDKDKEEQENPDADQDKDAEKEKEKEKEEERDEEEIEEIDINSPCVETLAAKIVPNTPAFAREIVILRALQHCENVTELYEVLESERTLISILELAQADVYNFFVGRGSTRHGWNLEKPAVREHFSKMVISNVVQGLDQMHNAKYLHCDLKSLNILLYIYVTDHSNRRGGVYIKAKLTDFGHSSHGTTRIAEKLFSNGMARVGTAGHVAPELFKEGTKCTEKIDIWSLGIVMFSMLVPGRLLFSEYTNLDTLKQKYDRLNKMNPWSRDRPSWWTDFERLSPEARDLILWMTRYDPSARPTCAEILKHPWFLIGKATHREHYRPKLKYVDMLCSSSIAQE
mmetsp:Transcript_49282/g.81966  ORF Transcript_49282/g.81966 Transcript_49282/m.81966 type:complete len:934 (-) Transcript_49282:621-3422(-)